MGFLEKIKVPYKNTLKRIKHNNYLMISKIFTQEEVQNR